MDTSDKEFSLKLIVSYKKDYLSQEDLDSLKGRFKAIHNEYPIYLDQQKAKASLGQE
jgi:hypothetical protein